MVFPLLLCFLLCKRVVYPMLVLSDQDIAKLLTMEEAIEAVEGAFAQLRQGKVVMPTRSTIMLPRYNGSISFMPSYLDESGAQATKIISIYPDNPRTWAADDCSVDRSK